MWWLCRALEPEKLSQRLAKSASNFILCFDGDAVARVLPRSSFKPLAPWPRPADPDQRGATAPGQGPRRDLPRAGVDAFHALTTEPCPGWTGPSTSGPPVLRPTPTVTGRERPAQEVDGITSNAVRAHYIDKIARPVPDDKEAKDCQGW